MKQQIPVDVPVTLIIQAVHGDLTIRGWSEPLLEWQCEDDRVTVHTQDTGLVLSPCQSDLTLKLPQSAEVHIATIHGDAHVTHLRRVSIDHISGDLTLRQITEQATIGVVNGDLTASAVAELTVTSDVQSDVTLTDVPVVRLTGVNGDLTGRGVLSLSLDQVAGDLDLTGLREQVQIRSVNGDVDLETSGFASASLEQVNGDLTMRGQAGHVQCLVVSGDIDTTEAQIDQLAVETVAGDVGIGSLATGRIATIGGDLEIRNITRELTIGTVGGDCTIEQSTGSVTLNTIGGDLWLRAAFTANTSLQAHVAGDATIVLPESPDVTVMAVVGGEISGIEGQPSLSGQTVEIRYGNGTASIHLHVGGDLMIKGADHPGSFNSMSAQLGKELSELGRELGRELSELGRSLAAELRSALSGHDPHAPERARAVAERFSEQAQRWRDTSGSEQVRVRINQREWRLDPERIERIKEQARQAAAAGLSSALEAVERALSRIQSPQSPAAPQPPQSPAAPQPPQPPAPPPSPATGPTIQLRNQVSQIPLNDAEREQQRASILQMVAEGRISPVEGDLLLAALDDTDR